MVKRATDLVGAACIGAVAAPVVVLASVASWASDRHNPFYLAKRVGLGGQTFNIVKLRSMVPDADKLGIDSTSTNDARITKIGAILRAWKLDELPQLWNVARGEMSLVGPRPQVESNTQTYTSEEELLLSVRPGLSDLASIAFADEGEILEQYADADLAYNQRIRPYKSRLGLFYVEHSSLVLDAFVLTGTVLAVVSSRTSRRWVEWVLRLYAADDELLFAALRRDSLEPAPPPGATRIFGSHRPSPQEITIS